jgi:hypothetical protein
MSILTNGIELIELGATAWRDIVNNNFSKIFTKTEVNNAIDVLKDVLANGQSAAYTLSLTDRGKSIDTTAGVTIPLSSTVAFPIGTVITITNMSAPNIIITATTGVTLRQAGTTTTGNRILGAFGEATIRKVAADTWYISGAGLS